MDGSLPMLDAGWLGGWQGARSRARRRTPQWRHMLALVAVGCCAAFSVARPAEWPPTRGSAERTWDVRPESPCGGILLPC
jgi:hypothetical protein